MSLHLIPGDPLPRVLYIDLTRLRFWVQERPDIFESGMGGAGAAIHLLEEECPAGCDPLAPENPIIFAVGPLVGYYPLASKTVAMFKSPHTGNLGESHAGGRSAVALRMAGYGALVIRGRSQRPLYLEIDENNVHFRDASALWGLRSSYTAGAVLRQNSEGSGYRTILRIGRAGEQMVSYACVISETYRHFGRLGLGAVFGSKQLKGLIIGGKRSLEVADKKAYRAVYDEIYRAATQTDVMRKYHQLGTPVNVEPLNAIGALPTRNVQSGRFEHADAISGEALAAGYLGRRVACAHCPVACIHLAALRLSYPSDPYFFKTAMIGYDHEPIYAVGSMLGIGDPALVLQVIDECEVHGLDVISSGVALAWASEALEKGLIGEKETGGLALRWGEAEAYLQAIRNIVLQPNDFYRALAKGTEHAASIYGGSDFAMSFGGNEMAGYHTGPGGYLGYLTGARHSHLDSAGYSLDQKTPVSSTTPEEIAAALLKEERWRQVLTSLSVCLFARGIYTPDVVTRALQAAGFGWGCADLEQMGSETLQRKNAFKQRQGFDFSNLRLPRRIFETPAPAGEFDEAFMRRAIASFAEHVNPQR